MTTKESFAALEAIKAEKNPYQLTPEEWRTFTPEQKDARYKQQREWENGHDARYLEAVHNIIPEVGLGCTILYWSDKRAATVTRIISPTMIEVTHNRVKCLDYYAGEYKILPELDERTSIFTKRKNGEWIMKGHKINDGCVLTLVYQDHYIAPSF